MATSWGLQRPIISLNDNTQSFSSTIFKTPPPDGLYYIANFGTGCSAKSAVPRPAVIRPLGNYQMDFFYKEQTTLNAGLFRLESTAPFEYIISHVLPDGTEMYCSKNGDKMQWNILDRTQLADTDRLVLVEDTGIPYTYFVKWKENGRFCRNYKYNTSDLCNSINSSMYCNDIRMADKRGDERFQFIPIFGITANIINTSFTAKDMTVTISNLPKRALIDPDKQIDQMIVASTTASPCIPDGLYYIFNKGSGNKGPFGAYRPCIVSTFPDDDGQVMFNGYQTTTMNASVFRLKADNTGSRTNTYIMSHVLPDGTEKFCSMRSDRRVVCKDAAVSSINVNDRVKLFASGTINYLIYLQWVSSSKYCRQAPGALWTTEQTNWVCNDDRMATKSTDDFFSFVPIHGIDPTTLLPYATFQETQTNFIGSTIPQPPGGTNPVTPPGGSSPGSTAKPGDPAIPPGGDDPEIPPKNPATPPNNSGEGTPVVPPGGTNNNSVTPPVKPGTTPPVVTPEGTWNSFTIALVVGIVVLVLMFVGISCVMMKG